MPYVLRSLPIIKPQMREDLTLPLSIQNQRLSSSHKLSKEEDDGLHALPECWSYSGIDGWAPDRKQKRAFPI